MKVTPLKSYRVPGFPTHAILASHPELLRLVPKRWRGNPVVLTALAAVCIMIAGCRNAASTDNTREISRIAPVFLHGEGRGAIGCVVVNPPRFLSEEEARKVIEEESKRMGISFESEAKQLPQITLPETRRFAFVDKLDPKTYLATGPLTLDGEDSKRHISYEFISEKDYQTLDKDPSLSTVSEFDFQAAAKDLKTVLDKTKPTGTYAVFYDPTEKLFGDKDPDWERDIDYKIMEKNAKQKAEKELREQVRDFINWLKAQGVI